MHKTLGLGVWKTKQKIAFRFTFQSWSVLSSQMWQAITSSSSTLQELQSAQCAFENEATGLGCRIGT